MSFNGVGEPLKAPRRIFCNFRWSSSFTGAIPFDPNRRSEAKHMDNLEKADFQVILLQNGNVEIKFLTANGQPFSATCSDEDIGNVATALLSAAHSSANLVGTPPIPQTGLISVKTPIPVNQWYFADIERRQEKAVVVEIGRVKIGFAVGRDQMRGLGRTMIAASWRSAAAHPSLRQLITEFWTELGFLGGLIWSRFIESVRGRLAILKTWLSGRSFGCFSVIHLAPGSPAPTYGPFKECIYCGSKIYSHRPNIRKSPLGAEHVIAEGLWGTLELAEASCQECEQATGAVVEGMVLGKTLKAIRVHLRLKKSGSGPPPKTLPLEATIFGQQKTIEVPIEDYPILFAMFAYAEPDLNATKGMPLVVGAAFVNFKLDLRMLFQKYGVGSFATPYLDNVMMCRMLAKIGHALAVAELGKHRFEPLLTNLIRVGNDRLEMRFIGGAPRSISRSPASLHSLALGYQKIEGTTYVVAHVQLFANYGGPTYAVVVGKSLESPIARFMRVLSSKTARMLAR